MKVAELFRNPEAFIGQNVEVEGLWLINKVDRFVWLVVDQIPFDVENGVQVEHIPANIKRVDWVCDELTHALVMSHITRQVMRNTQDVGSSGEFNLISSIKVTGKLEASENSPSPYIHTGFSPKE